MAFYFLHPIGSGNPKDERDFKYLIYSEKEIGKSISFDFEKGINYCPHILTETPIWNVDDELIDVVTKHTNSILVQFKKTHDILGFTIWKNQSM